MPNKLAQPPETNSSPQGGATNSSEKLAKILAAAENASRAWTEATPEDQQRCEPTPAASANASAPRVERVESPAERPRTPTTTISAELERLRVQSVIPAEVLPRALPPPEFTPPPAPWTPDSETPEQRQRRAHEIAARQERAAELTPQERSRARYERIAAARAAAARVAAAERADRKRREHDVKRTERHIRRWQEQHPGTDAPRLIDASTWAASHANRNDRSGRTVRHEINQAIKSRDAGVSQRGKAIRLAALGGVQGDGTARYAFDVDQRARSIAALGLSLEREARPELIRGTNTHLDGQFRQVLRLNACALAMLSTADDRAHSICDACGREHNARTTLSGTHERDGTFLAGTVGYLKALEQAGHVFRYQYVSPVAISRHCSPSQVSEDGRVVAMTILLQPGDHAALIADGWVTEVSPPLELGARPRDARMAELRAAIEVVEACAEAERDAQAPLTLAAMLDADLDMLPRRVSYQRVQRLPEAQPP